MLSPSSPQQADSGPAALGPDELASSTAREPSLRTTQVRLYSAAAANSPVATQTRRSPNDHRIFEQSTSDIWAALATCSKAVIKAGGIDPSAVKGVGFDATCSLAVVDRAGRPVSVSRSSSAQAEESDDNLGAEGQWNVILWADHRAEEEAELINSTGEGVLDFVGGTMSVSCRLGRSVADGTARDGDTQDPLAQEAHVSRQVQGVHVL